MLVRLYLRAGTKARVALQRGAFASLAAAAARLRTLRSRGQGSGVRGCLALLCLARRRRRSPPLSGLFAAKDEED